MSVMELSAVTFHGSLRIDIANDDQLNYFFSKSNDL